MFRINTSKFLLGRPEIIEVKYFSEAYSEPCQVYEWSFFAKILNSILNNSFCKKLHIKYLKGFWILLCFYWNRDRIFFFHVNMRYFQKCCESLKRLFYDSREHSWWGHLLQYKYFYKQPSCYGSNVNNGLKVKQPLTLKTLTQKMLVEFWVKNFTFSILSSMKLNLSTTVFGTTKLCTILFRAVTGDNRKIAKNC